ncbi:MAG: PAS domain-containing protein [Saprospiraceae bacterium]
MEPIQSSADRSDIRDAFDQICHLPFPIHVSDAAGNFLFANQKARKFFGLEDGQNLNDHNIGDCYEDPQDRAALLQRIRQIEPDTWLEDLTVRLHIQQEHHKIRFVSKPFFDAGRQLVALLCIANSITDLEWFAEFEDTFQAGFFEMDQQLLIADCNATFAKMLNFASPADVKGRHVGSLFWEPEKAQDLLSEIVENHHLKERQLKLRRTDGAMVIVKMSCITTVREAGKISRVKGVIRDVTFEIIQEEMPVGLFLVNTNQDGREIFSRVTPALARIFGFESPDDLLTRAIADFHPSPAAYESFRTELKKAASSGKPLLDYYMEVQDQQGKRRNVVTNVRYVTDENHHLRVGAAYDVTNHVGRHRRTLEANFSAVLHTYIATINGLRDTLNMLVKAHGHGISKPEGGIDRLLAAAELTRHRNRFETLFLELKKTAEERQVDSRLLTGLQKYGNNLAATKDTEKDSASWGRRNLIEIRKTLDGLKKLPLPRELVKNSRTEVDEMLRLTSMISISISVDEINERIPDFYYFRNYLLRGEAMQQELKTTNVVPLIHDTIQHLEEFASVNKVSIVQHFNPKENIPVACHRSSLSRALHSLLHNAIKYSWSKRLEDRPPWIDVRLEKRADEVDIVIENWGVPIRREELDGDKIFQFGRRGRESEDRGRAGTGIGLYDASEIIKEHGGRLRLSSEPTFGNQQEIYTNPFITKAFVTLPITPEK